MAEKRNYRWRDGNFYARVSNEIANRVNAYQKKYDALQSDFQKRNASRKYTYEDSYVSDSADWANSVSKRRIELDAEADSISAYIERFTDGLDTVWVNRIKNSIADVKKAQGMIADAATKDNEWWSSFENEDAYKTKQRKDGYYKKYNGLNAEDLKWASNFLEDGEEKDWLTSYASSVDYNEKSKFDVAAGEAEVQELTDYYNKAQSILLEYTGDPDEYDRQYAKLYEKYGSHKELENLINEKKQYIKDAKRVQETVREAEKWNSYTQAADFNLYASKGASIANPTFSDAFGSWIGPWQIGGEDIGNIVTFSRDNYNDIASSTAEGGTMVGNILYNNMTEDEVKLYNYLLAKEGKEVANSYLSYLEPMLKDAEGKRRADRITGIDIPVLEDLMVLGTGFGAGVENWYKSAESFFTGEEISPSILQSQNAYIGESLDGKFGQYAHQAATTIGNMAPSILVSYVLGGAGAPAALAQGVGASTMAVSAAGGAYSDALSKGYDKASARAYSTLVGASEGILQYLIGGVGKLGGVSGKVAAKIAAIDHSLLRAAAKLGVNIGSEILEEELQNFLEPAFRSIIFGEDYDAPTIDEIIETAIVTALSTGVLEAGGTIGDVKADNKAAKQYGGFEKELIQEGLESDKFSESYQFAQKYKSKMDSGKSLNGAEIRQLVEANDAAIVNESKEAKASSEFVAKNRLTELGETENVNKIAKLVAKQVSGQQLTATEKSTLVRSQYGAQVAKEMRQGEQTESGKRSFDVAYKSDATYKSLESRMEDETPAKVSDTGKAVINGTDQQVDLTAPKIKKITKDSVILEVDGKDVDIDDIEFANEDQWNVFNALKKVEHITPLVASDMVAKVDLTKPVWSQMNGMDEAFTYGYWNYSEADLKAGLFTGNLTKEQLNDTYKLGQYVRKNDVEADETNRKKMRTAFEAKMSQKERDAQQKARIESDDVDVYFMDGKSTVKFDEHTGKYDPKRTAAVNTAKFLKKLGIGGKFVFYESYEKNGKRYYKDANGKEKVAPNGFYDPADGSIYIDLNAGNDGSGTALFTMGHELAHFVKHRSEKQFKILADLVTEAFDKTDMSMHQRVLRKQAFLQGIRGNTEKVSYSEAYEEVVADAMSTMLTDGSFYDTLMEIKVKDKDLFATIKRFFQKMIAKFNKAYEELTPEQKDAQDIRELKDCFDKIQRAFAEGLVEASENFQAAENTTEAIENSDEIAYSKRGYQKVFFKENVFPPFNESHSEAHELAERWAKSEKTETGERKLISYHNQWYLIESFEDLKYGYQIMKKLTKQQYIKEASYYGTVTGYQSLQDSLSEDAAQHYRRGADGDAGYRSGNDASQHRGKNRAVHELGENKVRWETSERNGTRNLSSGSLDSQGENGSAVRNSDRDSQGNNLSEEQQEFFKNSKIVDANGNLKVMYHGSQESFTVFDKKKARSSGYYGKGFYFTDSNSHAKQYGNAYEVYLNITHPLQTGTKDITKEQFRKFVEAIAENEDYGLDNYGERATVDSVTNSVYGKGDFAMLMDINASCVGDLVAAVELFNEVNGTDYDGIIAPTETVAFHPEQIKRTDNKAPTSNPDMRFSERNADTAWADIHSRIFDLQSEEGRLSRSVEEFEASEDFKSVQDRMFHADSVEAGVNQYLEWREKSGYGSLLAQRDAVREELKKLREERDNIYANESAEKEQQAIAKSGLSEADYFRKQAVKEFGYTPYFYDAGYLTPNGKMLNFSGEKGKHFGSRGEDHRAIGIIYENTHGSNAMVRFMNDGNIRIMSETPGLDISSAVEPTSEQYATIRKFARESTAKGYFAVDISDENGRVIGNYEYDGYVNADRVVNDIKYFFEHGEAREQSSVARFLNSDRNYERDSTGKQLTKEQQEFFKDSQVRDKKGNLLVVYHGTTANFNIFKKGDVGFHFGTKGAARGRAGFGKNVNIKAVYLNITNPIVFDEDLGSWDADYRLTRELYDRGILTMDEAMSVLRTDDGRYKRSTEAANKKLADVLIAKGYDGITYQNTFETKKATTSYIAFSSNQAKETTNLSPTSNPDIRYSERGATKQDRAYLDAVNRGDMETAQKLVDEAAREWSEGNEIYTTDPETGEVLLKFYRSADGGRTVWNGHGNNQNQGVFLTSDPYIADAFDVSLGIPKGQKSGQHITVYAKAENPFVIDANGRGYTSIPIEEKSVPNWLYEASASDVEWSDEANAYVTVDYIDIDNLFPAAFKQGHDAVIVTNVVEGVGGGLATDVVLKDGGKQMKSADPVTYDDNGNVIPLSKRFNTENDDIRYSERGEDSSNRSLLANAFESITQNSEEYKLIQKYKGHIKDLNALDKALGKINAEIREIRFGKGKYDAKKLSELETKAKAIAGEITRHDKKLLSLEASEPLRKVIERERKKEAQKTREHVNEIQQNRKVRAEQTELRHKIRKTIRDLDKILNRGNKNQNVKEDLQPVVTKALQAAEILFTENYGNYDMLRNGIGANMSDAEEALVDSCAKMLKELDKMPADGYENWQARQEAENRLITKMSKLKDVFARERKRLNNTTVASILGELADAYASLEKSKQSYVQGAYSEAVHNFLKNLQSEVGGTIVNDMTKDQLESVYAAYKMVLTTVRKANQLFAENIKETKEQLAGAILTDFATKRAQREKNAATEAVYAVLDSIGWNNEKLPYAMRRIGSDSFSRLLQNIIDGEDITMRDVTEAIEFRAEMDKKYGFNSWDYKKKYEFTSKHGQKFELDLQQLMAFYAYSKREGAHDHITNGGIVLNTKELLRKKKADAYALTEDGIAELVNTLTAEQKAYVDEMQKYLSNVMGAKGNEVSLQLYGIKMFNEESYFPIRSSEDYLARAAEANLQNEQGMTNLASSGFTKALTPQASTPIVLDGFIDTWADHINEMSRYHGFVLPMEDFRKVLNYSTYGDDQKSIAVNAEMKNTFGEGAKKYFNDLYRELNAGAAIDRKGEEISRKMVSRYKKNAVVYSLSVTFQQPTAIVRAGALIDRKYFGMVLGSKGRIVTGFARLFTKKHKQLWEEIKQYAPGVVAIKEIGGFDTTTGGSILSALKEDHYSGLQENLKAFKEHPVKWFNKKADDNILARIPAYADQIAWVEIWNAVKRETLHTHKDMAHGSKEFLEVCGKRFSEVIRMTQVYDSVFAKSPYLRSQSLWVQSLTSFMAEPNTTINMVEDGLREIVRGNWKYGTRAIHIVINAIVFNGLAKSIIYAMRDDDEDETYIEKYLESFTGSLLDDLNPLNYIPFAKDVWNVFSGYGVERMDMSIVTDIVDTLERIKKLGDKETEDMTEEQLAEHEKAQADAWWGLADALSAFLRYPIKNIRRDAMGIYNTFFKEKVEMDNTKLSISHTIEKAFNDSLPVFLRDDSVTKQDKLYEAIISGDNAYLARMKSTYKTDSAYQSAVVKALRENDPRIKEAAQANVNGNVGERNRILNEIKAEGKFSASYIIDAINAETSAIRNDAKPDKVAGQYEAYDFVEAVSAGDANTAKAVREDIISTYVANGKTQTEAENAFKTDVKSSVNEAYSYGTITKATAEKMLVEYADMDEEDATDKITYLDFCKTNPNCDLSESKVLDYLEFAEPAHVSLEVYEQFVAETKDLADIKDEWGDVEVTKREQVLEVIDSLPLSWQQKDALYLAYVYAESKIWDVPW